MGSIGLRDGFSDFVAAFLRSEEALQHLYCAILVSMNRNRWTTFIAMLVAISGCTVLFFKKTELSALVQSACQKLIHLCSIQSSIYNIPPAVPERASINSNSSAATLKSEGLQPSEEPAPNQKTKGTSSLQEIKKLNEKDDICQLIQSKTIFDLDKTDLARLLDEKLTTPSKLLSDPSQLASPADDDLTRKFLYAIYLGGLLEGSPHPKELQLNESYRLLSQLAQSEPRNGSNLY